MQQTEGEPGLQLHLRARMAVLAQPGSLLIPTQAAGCAAAAEAPAPSAMRSLTGVPSSALPSEAASFRERAHGGSHVDAGDNHGAGPGANAHSTACARFYAVKLAFIWNGTKKLSNGSLAGLPQRNSGELNAALAADALELAATNPMAGWGGRAEHITGSQIGSFFTSRAAKLKSVQATVSKHEGTTDEQLKAALDNGSMDKKD